MGAGGRAAAPLQLGGGGGQHGGGGGHLGGLGGGSRHLLLALLLFHSGQASSDTSGPVFIQVKKYGGFLPRLHVIHLVQFYSKTIHVVLYRNLQTMSTSATQQV